MVYSGGTTMRSLRAPIVHILNYSLYFIKTNMSKVIISVMKKKMSLEERKQFIHNIETEYGTIEVWLEKINGKRLIDMFDCFYSFTWHKHEGFQYWEKIYKRFNLSELDFIVDTNI